MLNLNSPTVQAMMKNSPNGFGNMPVYYGNNPQVQTATIQPQHQLQQTQFQSPYPSPKEMLPQQGQQTIYQQTSFAPSPMPYPPNVVGMAHPGFVSNPYLNYQNNPGSYQYPYYGYQQYVPMDEETRITFEAATNNGVTYEEQVYTESQLYKIMSRIASKQIGRSEEEAKECENKFNVIDKEEERRKALQSQYETRKKKRLVMKVSIVCGEDVIASRTSEQNQEFANDRLESNIVRIEQAEKLKAVKDANRDYAFTVMHNQAIERKYDNTDMLEYFNGGGASEVSLAIQQQKLRAFNSTLIGKTYDSNSFKARLLKNNGLRSPGQAKAVEKYVGRYGYLPNGIPISPQHDPGMSECFSYNPQTGNFDVTLPNYMSKAFEGARSRFLRSLDDT